MKHQLSVLTLAVSLLALAPAAPAAERLSLATGGTAGTYYPIGGAMAKAASKSGAITVTSESGNASVANINLLGKKEIELGMVQNDVYFWAYNGEHMFTDKAVKNLRTVMALYPEDVHIVVTKASGIKSTADLKGKRVSVGAAGSGVEADAQMIVKVTGITYSDFDAQKLDFAATATRFKDNQIDAGFLTTGYPSPAIMDIATTKDITLIDFDDAFLDKLGKAYPYFVPHIIPGGTYKGIDKDTKVPAVVAIVATHDGVSEQVIYEFLKGVFDNLGDVQIAHAKAKEITLQNAINGLPRPLHPGAVKFFKEKGLKVD
jgi:TRAP transporter TAXI family solute receptor